MFESQNSKTCLWKIKRQVFAFFFHHTITLFDLSQVWLSSSTLFNCKSAIEWLSHLPTEPGSYHQNCRFFFSSSRTACHPWQQWPKCFCTGYSSSTASSKKKNPISNVVSKKKKPLFNQQRQEIIQWMATWCSANLCSRFPIKSVGWCLSLLLVCVITEDTFHEIRLAFFISGMFHRLQIRCSLLSLHKTNSNPKSLEKVLQLFHQLQLVLPFVRRELCKLTRVVYHRQLLHWPL